MRSALTGSRIRQRRTLVGLRQSELARRVGVSPSYLNLIEHNRRRVAQDLLERLAGALGVPVAMLAEGTEAAVAESLRDAAARYADPAAPSPELDRLEDLAGRFPGWLALIAAQQHRLAALERTVERLTDRMTHDPHLSAALHELLSVAASLQSTATILAESDEIAPEWLTRFHGNLHLDAQRMSEGAQALVAYLDAFASEESGIAAPQEEFEAWLSTRGYHIAEMEGADAAKPQTLIEGQAELASPSARELALNWLHRYRADALALPMQKLRAAVARDGPDPALLSQRADLGADLPRLLRRLASLPAGMAGMLPVGLIICDGSGTLTFRKPVPGFSLPRFGAACPLWPLYQALSRPLAPVRARLTTVARPVMHFDSYAICAPRAVSGFDAPQVLESVMLLVPLALAQPDGTPEIAVGSNCRICSRARCPARREPSITGVEG